MKAVRNILLYIIGSGETLRPINVRYRPTKLTGFATADYSVAGSRRLTIQPGFFVYYSHPFTLRGKHVIMLVRLVGHYHISGVSASIASAAWDLFDVSYFFYAFVPTHTAVEPSSL